MCVLLKGVFFDQVYSHKLCPGENSTKFIQIGPESVAYFCGICTGLIENRPKCDKFAPVCFAQLCFAQTQVHCRSKMTTHYIINHNDDEHGMNSLLQRFVCCYYMVVAFLFSFSCISNKTIRVRVDLGGPLGKSSKLETEIVKRWGEWQQLAPALANNRLTPLICIAASNGCQN